MCLLQLFVTMFSFINVSKCNSIAFEFTSKDINDSENFVIFTPEPNVSFKTGLTICLRVKFEFWNRKTVFIWRKIQLDILPFALKRVMVQLEKIWLNFGWPEDKITTATTWYLFRQPFFTHNSSVTLEVSSIKFQTKNLDSF